MNARRKKTMAALLFIAFFAVVGASLDKGSLLGIFDRTRNNRTPSDSKENLFYSRKKPCTSENIIDRSGFAFLNLRNRIVAVELASGVNVTVVEKTAEQDRYRKFSEYASYVYLYDGKTLWRTQVDGKRVSRIADNVLDYEPMGNYVYFLKEKNGEPRLFRSWLTGSGQEMLFDFPVYEFRAFAGVILMLRTPRRDDKELYFTSYNVLTQESADLRLPADAEQLWNNESHLYYTVSTESGKILYRRSLADAGLAENMGEGFTNCQVGPDGIAMLLRDADGTYLAYRDARTREVRRFTGKRFGEDAVVDLSWDRIYVTEEGGIYHSPVEKEAWSELPLEARESAGPSAVLSKNGGNAAGNGT